MRALHLKQLSLAAVALTASTFLLSCGGSDTTTTIIQTASTSPDATTTEEPAQDPSGELSANSVGEVTQGTTIDDAIAAFGQPDRRTRTPGCEFNPQDTPRFVLTYNQPDGSLAIYFAASNEEMISYRTTSKRFPTSLGDRVGDSFESVQGNWGTALRPLNLGVQSTASDGYWFVKDSPKSELLFAISGGRIKSIAGGFLPPCE